MKQLMMCAAAVALSAGPALAQQGAMGVPGPGQESIYQGGQIYQPSQQGPNWHATDQQSWQGSSQAQGSQQPYQQGQGYYQGQPYQAPYQQGYYGSGYRQGYQQGQGSLQQGRTYQQGSSQQGAVTPSFQQRFQPLSQDLVQVIQYDLKRRGFYQQGSIDGLWGDDTVRALENFQRATGLRATGQLDLPTMASLGLGQQIQQQAGQGYSQHHQFMGSSQPPSGGSQQQR